MISWFEIASLLVATVVFYLPFFNWPVDPHFGSNAMWALFRKNGEPLPEEVVLGNAGCSRIFLHYVVLAALRLFGRKNLHISLRAIQAGCFFVCACLLCTSVQSFLGLPPLAGLMAGLLLVFTASRPQLQSTYVNAEPFYALAQAAGMVLLLASASQGWPTLGLAAYACVLVFAGLHTKPPFLVEPALVGTAFWLVTGPSLASLAAFGAASLAGAGLFALLMRRHIHPGAYGLMNAYHASFRAGLTRLWPTFLSRWQSGLNRSPLAGVAFLCALGLVLPPWDASWFVLGVWFGVTSLLLVLQLRFELYHFLVVLPAACLLAGRGLGLAWNLHPLVALTALAVAAALMRRAFQDVPFYYGKAPLAAKLARAFPDVFPFYFDMRLPAAVEHFQSVRTPDDRFVGFGIVPQIHYLADVPPVSSYTFFHPWMEFLLPAWKDILLRDLRRARPRWLYDFNTWTSDYGRANPLSLFAATGLGYVAFARFENVVCYRLLDATPAVEPDESAAWPLYVYRSPLSDFLRQELGHTRRDPPPPDMASLVVALLDTSHAPPPFEIERAVLGRLAKPSPWGVLETFGALALLRQGDHKGARALLARPCPHLQTMVQLSPTLALAREALSRLAGGKAKPLELTSEALNRQAADEVLAVVRMLTALATAGLLSGQESVQLSALLRGIKVDKGPWSPKKVERCLLRERDEWLEHATASENAAAFNRHT